MARGARAKGGGAGGGKSVRDTKLYDDLEIKPDASAAEVRSSYYRLAKLHHPDKNPDAAPDAFHAIQTAYEVLSDEDLRAEYDALGMAAVDGGRGGEDFWEDEDDGFGPGPSFSFFDDDGFGPRRQRRPKQKGGRSPDSSQDFKVTLEDLFKGRKVVMEVEKTTNCSTCKGSGLRPKGKASDCQRCDGSGYIVVVRPMGPSMLAHTEATCPSCEGEGEKIKAKDACKKCRGTKTKKETTKVEWWIEKGMLPGDVVTLANEGDCLPGCTPGDLFLRLVLVPSKTFTLLSPDSRDLALTLTLTLSETLLGLDRILFTHLDGRGIHARLPGPHDPGYKVVRPGDTMKLVGEGLPGGRKGRAGDLWIKWEVAWPSEAWVRSRDPSVWKALESNLPPKRTVEPSADDTVEQVELVRAEMPDRAASEPDDERDGTPQCPTS